MFHVEHKLNSSFQRVFEKSDAGSLAWQADGCKGADPKYIPEDVENRGPRRRPFAAPRCSRLSFQTGSQEAEFNHTRAKRPSSIQFIF